MNQKQKWGVLRDRIYPQVNKLLVENGYQEVTMSSISPKAVRLFQKNHYVTLRDWEFDGKKLFIFFEDNWDQMIDTQCNPINRLCVYTLPRTVNFKEVYKEFNIDDLPTDKGMRYSVPIEDFMFLCGEKEKLVSRQSGLISRSNKKQTMVASGGEIMFPTEEDVEMGFANGTEIEDELIKNQSYRDYLTMRYLVPVSTKPWLNKVVKQIHEEMYGK